MCHSPPIAIICPYNPSICDVVTILKAIQIPASLSSGNALGRLLPAICVSMLVARLKVVVAYSGPETAVSVCVQGMMGQLLLSIATSSCCTCCAVASRVHAASAVLVMSFTPLTSSFYVSSIFCAMRCSVMSAAQDKQSADCCLQSVRTYVADTQESCNV
jgi:hypothetical protein